MSTPTPSYYAIVPSNVRYCKDLEPSAKLLYGELTALTHVEGYCWASNQYFATLYEVDISTIKRWLRSLEDNKFIKIDTEKNGIHWQRRIWISPEIQKVFTKAQKCTPPSSKMHPPQLKNEPHNTTTNNTEKKEEREGQAPQTPPPTENFFKDKFEGKVVLTEKQYKSLLDEFGPEPVDDMLNIFYDYSLSQPKEFNKYHSHVATVRNWIRREIKKQPVQKLNHFNENKAMVEERAKGISDALAPGSSFKCFDTYVEVKISLLNYSERIYYKDGKNAFINQINASVSKLKEYSNRNK